MVVKVTSRVITVFKNSLFNATIACATDGVPIYGFGCGLRLRRLFIFYFSTVHALISIPLISSTFCIFSIN